MIFDSPLASHSQLMVRTTFPRAIYRPILRSCILSPPWTKLPQTHWPQYSRHICSTSTLPYLHALLIPARQHLPIAYSVSRDGRRKKTAYTIDLYNKPLHTHIRALTKHIWVLGYDIPEPTVPPRTCGFLRPIPPWVYQGGIHQKVGCA